jgi:hypothetical protein
LANDEVYHRLESDTQTPEDAKIQTQTREIWGRPARGSNIPSVKAYRGKLPSGQRGVQLPKHPSKARIKSTPLPGVLKNSEFIPQAIVRRPVDAFARPGADVFSGTDDLDEYRGVGFLFGNVAFTIMHYKGHPADTSTIYLPPDIRDLQAINKVLRAIFSHFKVRDGDIAWQRKDSVDL